MALKTLKPRLTPISTTPAPILDTKAGTTEMPRGRAWMETRRRIAMAYGYRCVACGLIWQSHKDQIDHVIPREQGGSNADSNLRPMCHDCHATKTAKEAKQRAGSN